MLVPLTREKFEQLIPRIATGPQYKYCWGKFPDFLQRLLISVVITSVIVVVEIILRLTFGPVVFFIGLIGALYWFWGPVFWASLKNLQLRRYKYSGYFRGRVQDIWISEELVGRQRTVNNKGDLVIVENREKRINLEVGDDTGFYAELSAPLQVVYKAIARGQIVEMVVLSNSRDLSTIEEITDAYIPSRDLWVSDYPYLRRDFFTELSSRLRRRDVDEDDRPRRGYDDEDDRPRRRRYDDEDDRPRRRYDDEDDDRPRRRRYEDEDDRPRLRESDDEDDRPRRRNR